MLNLKLSTSVSNYRRNIPLESQVLHQVHSPQKSQVLHQAHSHLILHLTHPLLDLHQAAPSVFLEYITNTRESPMIATVILILNVFISNYRRNIPLKSQALHQVHTQLHLRPKNPPPSQLRNQLPSLQQRLLVSDLKSLYIS